MAINWHTLTTQEVFERLGTGNEGLSADEAASKLKEHGPNRLPRGKKRGSIERFMSQFNNLLIYVLLVSAAVTAILGHWVDASVIAGVVVINAIIGFIQEGKAEKAIDAIRMTGGLRGTCQRASAAIHARAGAASRPRLADVTGPGSSAAAR
jgi:magnesium-transporting ATPase (P-type)